MSFADLSLREPLQRALREEGYATPTPIQLKAIPHVLAGRDLIGIAQTGTGKTAAFGLPILDRLSATPPAHGRRAIRALVLSPTRELAAQIGDSLKAYGRHTGLRHAVIFGGVGQAPQERVLRDGLDILVACPGRLLDLMGQRLVDLRSVEVFVLDEADRMLDMGFVHDVKRVITALPARRQNLLFSATMPGEVERLAATLLHDPVRVEAARVSSAAETVEQAIFHVEKSAKGHLLRHLLRDAAASRVLVFTRTKHGADKVARLLSQSGIGAEAIHGNKSQNARTRALDAFKRGSARVLVASDIAARGLDIDEITHVVNFDLPNEPETYVHRIGRTGRAGATGIAWSFCSGEERPFLADIEKLIRRRIAVVRADGFVAPPPAPVLAQPHPQRHQGGRQGHGQGRGGRNQGHGGRDQGHGHAPRSAREARPAAAAPAAQTHSAPAKPLPRDPWGRRGPSRPSSW